MVVSKEIEKVLMEQNEIEEIKIRDPRLYELFIGFVKDIGSNLTKKNLERAGELIRDIYKYHKRK